MRSRVTISCKKKDSTSGVTLYENVIQCQWQSTIYQFSKIEHLQCAFYFLHFIYFLDFCKGGCVDNAASCPDGKSVIGPCCAGKKCCSEGMNDIFVHKHTGVY